MKILLLGNTGQVGWELNRTLITLGKLTALDYPQIDMADPSSIRALIQEVKPHIIVNATAYTNVDKAESEPDLSMAINGTGPGILALEAKKIGAALIHYSTDYVFDGKKGSPYIEEDQPNPISVYGETKLAGEIAIQEVGGSFLIFRTSWVYSLRQGGFVNKFLGWASKNDSLIIVDDQIANPTSARMLAEITGMVISRNKEDLLASTNENAGLYHLAGDGYCSRFEWTQEILAATGQVDKKLIPGKTKDFPSPAERPLFSALTCVKFQNTFGFTLPDWRTALTLTFDEYLKN